MPNTKCRVCRLKFSLNIVWSQIKITKKHLCYIDECECSKLRNQLENEIFIVHSIFGILFSLALALSFYPKFPLGITNDSDGTDPNRCRMRGRSVRLCSFYRFSTIRNGSLLIIHMSNGAFFRFFFFFSLAIKSSCMSTLLVFFLLFTPWLLLALTLLISLNQIHWIVSFRTIGFGCNDA